MWVNMNFFDIALILTSEEKVKDVAKYIGKNPLIKTYSRASLMSLKHSKLTRAIRVNGIERFASAAQHAVQ